MPPLTLTPGQRLGPYEVVSALGAGGMGEVYKAKDTRLDRIVAIKVLPAQLAGDPQFRERFEREAKSISALNHSNICTLYDVGRDHNTDFLVMEYLEGETLADRLAKSPLPLIEALRIGSEIASALDKAHRQGIVHRDLKPGNVFLVRSGGASAPPITKLLDFGLAKTGPPRTLSGAGATALPTALAPLTAQGTILGTFQYMAPEQIEGEDADARTDIFAFGAVLYEMLTGRKAFQGKSPASLLGAILKDEPPPVSQVQPVTPPALDYLVRTCLAKDPDDRFQTAHDLLLQLRWITEHPSAAGMPAPVVGRRRRERLAWIAAAVFALVSVAAGVIAIAQRGEAPPAADPVQFEIDEPKNSVFATPLTGVAHFAISPDGRQVVFVAVSGGVPMLTVRPLATLAVHALPGTEQASFPFWSSDSRYIGFFASGKLKKIPVGGGPPVVLCDAPLGLGGTWNRDNVIVFAPLFDGPLQQVTSAGGVPTPVTTLDKSETSHRWPSFLPDGRHVLYLALRRGIIELRVGVLGSSETTSLGASESNGVYAAGHLLFSRGGSLMAQPFDPETRQAKGDPFPVAENVVTTALAFFSSFSVSATGVLGYFRGRGDPTSRLTWMDRAGRSLGVVGEPGVYFNLSLSPDERRVAVAMAAGSPPNHDIWLIDLARAATASRLTFDPAPDADPIWSPDGLQVLFTSSRTGGEWSLFRHAANGNGQDESVMKPDATNAAPDWSRDGRFLVYDHAGGPKGDDLWVLPFFGDRKPFAFLQTPFNEDNPAFSPDGRWIAYDSDSSGRSEVYIRPFPATSAGGQLQISRNGGWAARWRGDGKELFFLALDGTMMAAGIETAKDFQAAVPQPLFQAGLLQTSARHTYAVTRDGKRFLVPVTEKQSSTAPITIVLNWPASVQK